MTIFKNLALAGVAVAGIGMFASTDAEARGGRGGHGGFHRGGGMHFGHGHFGFHRHHHWGHRHGAWRHGRWIGLGAVTVGASCYRYRWVETPYGAERRLVNVCAY